MALSLSRRRSLCSCFFPISAALKDPDAALPEIALYVGGKLFQSIFLCSTFVNTLAGLASHASVSRLLYVMGRDNVFPERGLAMRTKMADSGTERHYGRDCRDVGAVLRFSYRHSVN
ncbi:hypothetical protein ACLB1R_11175 [Escherichia coli]